MCHVVLQSTVNVWSKIRMIWNAMKKVRNEQMNAPIYLGSTTNARKSVQVIRNVPIPI